MAMTDLEVAVQLLGGPTNKVIYDDLGLPSIMVRFDKGNNSDVLAAGTETTHPAFRVNDAEIPHFWYSKYQNIIINDRAYSLPLQDPKVYINFDNARLACERKGAGWHLGTNAEWAWIALQCRKNGFMPHGNNNFGKDCSYPHEKGVVTYQYTSNDMLYNGRVATGSGPKSWAHNNDPSGVWDLNGNMYEWVGGFRLVDGEIQILPYNNAADANNPQTKDSTLWKAILPDGSLVNPGTAGTLKYDYKDGTNPSGTGSYGFQVNTTLANPLDNETGYGAQSYATLATATGVTIPEVMKALALFPEDTGSHGSDYIYMRNKGERLVYRGGIWSYNTTAGVFSFYANSPRSRSHNSIGFRSAFAEL